jgi:hypothetical protein
MSDLAHTLLRCHRPGSLQEELEKNKEELAKNTALFRMVHITGPEGSPVYAERHHSEKAYDNG